MQETVNERFKKEIDLLIESGKAESYGQIAEKLKFKSKSSISGMINGSQKPTIDVLISLKRLYSIDPNKILFGQLDTVKEQPRKAIPNENERLNTQRIASESSICGDYSKTQRGVMVILGISYSTSLRDPQIIKELIATRDTRMEFLYGEIEKLIEIEESNSDSTSGNPDDIQQDDDKRFGHFPLKDIYHKDDIKKTAPKETDRK